MNIPQRFDRRAVSSPGNTITVSPSEAQRRTHKNVVKILSSDPLGPGSVDVGCQRIYQNIQLAVLQSTQERDASDALLVLAVQKKAPKDEAFMRKGSLIGNKKVIQKSIDKLLFGSEMGLQRAEKSLFGFHGLCMVPRIEAYHAKHGMQVGKDDLQFRTDLI